MMSCDRPGCLVDNPCEICMRILHPVEETPKGRLREVESRLERAEKVIRGLHRLMKKKGLVVPDSLHLDAPENPKKKVKPIPLKLEYSYTVPGAYVQELRDRIEKVRRRRARKLQ